MRPAGVAFLICLGACTPPVGVQDLGFIGSETATTIHLEPGDTAEYDLRALGGFYAQVDQAGPSMIAIDVLGPADVAGVPGREAQVSVLGAPLDGERPYRLVVRDLGDEPVDGDLRVGSNEPSFDVHFTVPQCAAIPDLGVPAGAHCYATPDENDQSRYASGVTEGLVQWIDDTRRVKEEHPERRVTITLAAPIWSDASLYPSMCAAVAGGVDFEGSFDAPTSTLLASRLGADPACHRHGSGRVQLHVVPGLHENVALFDTGEPMTRIMFSSGALTTDAATIDFEGWVFARFATDSAFVAAHRCGLGALQVDPELFQESYRSCLAKADAPVDPRYQVFFTPDSQEEALTAAVTRLKKAGRSVSVAGRHLSAPALAGELAACAGLDTRLVLDDDTFYGEGTGAAADAEVWSNVLHPAGLGIRFLQTNAHIPIGPQVQDTSYLVVDGRAVFAGAGDFTASAFTTDYAAFYLLDDATVAAAYQRHFDRLWTLARPAENLPESSNF